MKKQIYFIENEENLKELINFFEKLDEFEILGHSTNGQDGLKEIISLAPDIVIMDIVISDLDGLSILEYFKTRVTKTKFIIVSNISNENLIEKAVKLGACYYMIKPIDLNLLKTRITESTFAPRRSDYKINRTNFLDERISSLFVSIGIPAHIRGYQYLRQGIKLAIEDPYIINGITKRLYPSIAEYFNTSSSKVERAIRHAIEVAWSSGRIENINNLFGVKIYNKFQRPTNGEFIALIADKLLLEGA